MQEALYQSVMQFGMAVPLKMGKGADKKGRDQEESYHVVEGQLAGNVKLVSAWHAVGQQVIHYNHSDIHLIPCFI